ncbi:MAG: sulfur carrier protein ThiS [Henriciella sp.]|nr:sulfur carrier protein ThiS [Henriciella sp.]
MQVFLNGTAREISPGLTLEDLVRQIADDPRGIAIERNLEIVPKAEHKTVILEEGDRLEVVQFVGGG